MNDLVNTPHLADTSERLLSGKYSLNNNNSIGKSEPVPNFAIGTTKSGHDSNRSDGNSQGGYGAPTL